MFLLTGGWIIAKGVTGGVGEKLDEYRGEADSLAGLLLEKQGFMPVKDSVIEVGVYGFKVLEATNKRIIKVQVILPRNVV